MMLWLALTLCIATASALYNAKGAVLQVGANDFKSQVLKDKGIVLVEFYAPWCGHCKNLAPEYEKAASVLQGVVKVVAVDATQHESLAQQYQIQGFPTIKVFGADKKNPIDYQGQRTADAMITEAMKATNALVKDRKAGKTSSSAKAEKKSSAGSGKKDKANAKASKSAVVELTDVNFNALVMDSNEHWLVEFYAPWCGHCKRLAPEWESAAKRLAGDGVKLGAVDATVHTELAAKYDIRGFPSIKVFAAGPKGAPQDYNGAREADAIVDFALQSLEATGAPVQINQLVNQETFTNTCARQGSKLCVLVFLPHILDSGAAGRNAHLATLQDIASGYRKMPFSFFWTEGTAQPGLEETLSINGNYPNIAVLSLDKNVYAVPKMSWSKKNVESFLSGVLSGSEKTTKLATKPKVVTVTAWDGKDAKVEADEIPLSELFGDEL